MRYFLTRLYDYSNTPKTALLKLKILMNIIKNLLHIIT